MQLLYPTRFTRRDRLTVVQEPSVRRMQKQRFSESHCQYPMTMEMDGERGPDLG